jgi:hypothetical protein
MEDLNELRHLSSEAMRLFEEIEDTEVDSPELKAYITAENKLYLTVLSVLTELDVSVELLMILAALSANGFPDSHGTGETCEHCGSQHDDGDFTPVVTLPNLDDFIVPDDLSSLDFNFNFDGKEEC